MRIVISTIVSFTQSTELMWQTLQSERTLGHLFSQVLRNIFRSFCLARSHMTCRKWSNVMWKSLLNNIEKKKKTPQQSILISQVFPLTFSWDLDTLPLLSRSRAVKPYQMDLSSSERRSMSVARFGFLLYVSSSSSSFSSPLLCTQGPWLTSWHPRCVCCCQVDAGLYEAGDSSATCRMDIATLRGGDGGRGVSEDNGNVLSSGSRTEITKHGFFRQIFF